MQKHNVACEDYSDSEQYYLKLIDIDRKNNAINSMIPGSKGYMFYARVMGPAKHEKVARIGRISHVFRIARVPSVEQSVGIMGAKYLLNQRHSIIIK